MSLEKNKAIARRWIEAFNQRNLALLDKLMAPDYVDQLHQLRGLEDVKQFLSMLLKGFPDFHMTIEDIIAEADKVWIRITETMTHTGEYRGIAPTWKKITEPSVWIIRIVDGKVVERQSSTVRDELDFLKQLGVIEYKGFPDEVT